MRCPECTQRNSVAASKCQSCGHKFKKKPVSRGAKITLAAGIGLIVVWAIAAAIIPSFTDPEQNLVRIAKAVASGPANGNQAEQMHNDLDNSLKNFLATIGAKSDADLVGRLKKIFPDSAFEIHVVDLPRDLRIVEVDTVLQANGYLVMKNNNQAKVFPLTGLEVFDDARVINESAGPMLVLLGHSSGQPPHKPHVKLYALMPDGITDETDKLLPPLSGEGLAHFAKNGRDIVLDLSLLSLGQSEKLFAASNQNEDATVHQDLDWRDAHYVSRYEYGSNPFVALYAVARCMRYPNLVESHHEYLGAQGEELIKNYKSADAGNFEAVKLSGTPDKVNYRLTSNVGRFDIAVGRSGSNWQVISARAASSSVPVVANDKTAPIVTRQAPIVTQQAPSVKTATATPASTHTISSPTHVTATLSHHKHNEESAANAPTKSLHEQRNTENAPTRSLHEQRNTETASTALSSGQGLITSPESVNLRPGPSVDGHALDQVPSGAKVKIIGERKGWYKVRYQGKVGYLWSDLVSTKNHSVETSGGTTKSPAKTVASGKSKPSEQLAPAKAVAASKPVTNDAPPPIMP